MPSRLYNSNSCTSLKLSERIELGTFPIVEAQDYAATLPDYIKQRGDYLMPLFQREALWMSIGGGPCAIKISVGGINTITGDKRDEQSPNDLQDYVIGKQPWLDGIATEPGVVWQAYDYPWFDLYDGHLPKVHHHGAFSKIRSIFTLDSAPLPSYALLDPQSPPSCPRHPAAKAVCVARPCGHPACSECLGESIGSATSKCACVVCKRKEKHVRFDKPVATAQCGGGSKGAWWEGEAQIEGVLSGSAGVVTLMLEADSVSRLHSASANVSLPYSS